MINERSIKACDSSRFGPFCKPLYDSYNFSRIPHTIEALYGGKKERALPQDCYIEDNYEYILLIFIDSFGWRYFEQFSSQFPFLKRFIEQGIVSKISSQFPSTTTNHVTSIHTGLNVGESGLYEWFCYEPLVDASICPLHFSFTKDKGFNTLKKTGISAEQLFPFETIYSRLKRAGIRSIAFQESETSRSPYSQQMFIDTELIGIKNLPDGLNKLIQKLERVREKSYFFFYHGDIDGKGHEFGPESKQVADEIANCFIRLEQFFQHIAKIDKKGLLLVTADHGMISIHPETTWYINRELPEVIPLIKKNAQGELIAPCGSARDLFLHIEEEAIPILKKSLMGIAEVYTTKELIRQGLFGPINQRFLDRVGNVVILPLGENSCWWHDPERFTTAYHGHHGGLSVQEVETIFLALSP